MYSSKEPLIPYSSVIYSITYLQPLYRLQVETVEPTVAILRSAHFSKEEWIPPWSYSDVVKAKHWAQFAAKEQRVQMQHHKGELKWSYLGTVWCICLLKKGTKLVIELLNSHLADSQKSNDNKEIKEYGQQKQFVVNFPRY